MESFPASLHFNSEPNNIKSSYLITSAFINPFSKSVCITPAAWGAIDPFLTVQALTSFSPAVKYVIRSKVSYEALISLSNPDSLIP